MAPPDEALADRAVGAVLGLAIGDALGAPFEFRRRDQVPDPLPAFELPWMGMQAGTTTDDTAMARSLVRSLAERGGFDPDDLVRRHLEWFASEPPDVGNLTRRVLSRVARGGVSATDAARAVWEERGPEVSAGNGSVMYCAPLGVAYASRPAALHELAPRLSALTHHDERCRTAVLSITLGVAALVRGGSAGDAIDEALGPAVVEREGGEELEFLAETGGTGRRVDGPDLGFCLFTAGIGLQVLARTAAGVGEGFEGELRRVVGFGGDADTNAAVAGAVLGAALGRSRLPQGWLDRLADGAAIEREAEGLVDLARAT